MAIETMLESKLNLIRNAKRFAVERLGIAENPSFEKVKDINGFYGVFVAWKHRLSSPFGDAYGKVSFSNEKKAKRYQKRCKKRDLDTDSVIWNATGRYDCPITRSILTKEDIIIVELVLHENFHIHLDINNIWIPRCTEESLAQIFAYFGSLLFFESQADVIQDTKIRFQNRLKLCDFINDYTQKLVEAYHQGLQFGRNRLEVAREEAIASNIKLGSVVNNTTFLSRQCYAIATRSAFEMLEGSHPREYTIASNIRSITKKLPLDPEGRSQMIGLSYLLG